MPEIFLILLSGGIMLAAAISDPRAVILRWLRLAGILSLTMTALAAFFVGRRDVLLTIGVFSLPAIFILGQLAFVQIAKRKTQRILSALATISCVASGVILLRQIQPIGLFVSSIACLLAAAMMGLALMDMLLGHAYLNAAQMTMSPFKRLNLSLAVTMFLRAILSLVAAFFMRANHPIEMFWNLYGLYVGTRWLVGFAVPGVFVWMTHECIKRRATQSATGILYVAGTLIFLGEIIGLYLMSQTGLPL